MSTPRNRKRRKAHADQGAGIAGDDVKARVKDLRARVNTHAVTVKAGNEKTNAPEMAEYVARWNTYVDELKAVEERLASTFSWVTEDEIRILEAQLKNFLLEWPNVALRIDIRKNDATIATLEELNAKQRLGLPTASHTELPPVSATAPPPFVPSSGFAWPNIDVNMPKLPGPSIPAWVWLGVGGVALVLVVSQLRPRFPVA